MYSASESGAGAIEYSFLAGFIAGVVVLIVAVLGHQTNGLYCDTADALTSGTMNHTGGVDPGC